MDPSVERHEPSNGSRSPRKRKRRRRRRRRSRGSPTSRTPEPKGPLEAAARRLGITKLYAEQQRVIDAALGERDALVVLPTGFGKSACYQIPSMVLSKPVVLISPLLALIRDQYEKLLRLGIPCVRLDGTVRGKARQETLQRIAAGGPLLVMTTPETLGSNDGGEALATSGIGLVAVDEAHCISAWGHDFRPAYIQIGERLEAFGSPPTMALTATATENVREDIVRYLALRKPEIVEGSPHRANLAFEVIEARGNERLRALMRLSRRLRRPGIIYCSTTREVDNVFAALRLLRIPAHRYHGKMTGKERNEEQEMYMKPGRRTVMVATNAFGLGIDKPDIRFIVHYQSPASLEQYVQEAGRAGRDGKKANCILLHDPDDRKIHEALLAKSRIRPEQLYKLGRALAAWAGENRTPTVEALGLSAGQAGRTTSALLAVLEEAGLVRLSDGTAEVLVPASSVEEESRELAGQFETLRTQDARRLDTIGEYAHATDCRAIFLRQYFGEEGGEPCGLCDTCRGRPSRPESFWTPLATPEFRKKKKRKRSRKRRRKPKDEKGQAQEAARGAQPETPLPQSDGEEPTPPPPSFPEGL